MIHGQFVRGKGALAVRTDPCGNLMTPPRRLAERLRFPFFSGDMPGIFLNVNPVSHVTSFFSSWRGLEWSTGAEDGQVWRETVRMHARDGGVAAHAKAAISGGSCPLDGEGILKALHPLFQVLNLPLLLGQQEVFDALESFCHLLIKCFWLLRSLSEAVTHVGERLRAHERTWNQRSF
jgi:hypothetical protein